VRLSSFFLRYHVARDTPVGSQGLNVFSLPWLSSSLIYNRLHKTEHGVTSSDLFFVTRQDISR
jgi:hypothetical protein